MVGCGAEPLANHLADHNTGQVSIGTRHKGHDGSICDYQIVESMGTAVLIHHRHRVFSVTHLDGTTGVIATAGKLATELGQAAQANHRPPPRR